MRHVHKEQDLYFFFFYLFFFKYLKIMFHRCSCILILRATLGLWYFANFSKIIGIGISWKLSPKQTICMKYQSLFSGKNKKTYFKISAGLGGSVGCAVRLETRRSWVQTPPRSATFFRGDWSWNIFYGHSLPSADSRRADVSFWRKNVHNIG